MLPPTRVLILWKLGNTYKHVFLVHTGCIINYNNFLYPTMACHCSGFYWKQPKKENYCPEKMMVIKCFLYS